MPRKNPETGEPIVPRFGADPTTDDAKNEPDVDVFEVLVDAIGNDAIKGDLVTRGDVTWDFDFLLLQNAVRPAPEYMRAYHDEGLRSATQPKEGQPHQATDEMFTTPQAGGGLAPMQPPAEAPAFTPATPVVEPTGEPAPVEPVQPE